MKFRTLLIITISIFLFKMSDVNAVEVVSDGDQSTLCYFSGVSVDIFTTIPGLPSTMVIPHPGATLSIEASSDSDEFIANLKFNYLDKEKVLLGVDYDDIGEYGYKVISGNITVQDALDFASKTYYSDIGKARGYIRNNFTVISNTKEDMDPALNKIFKNSSSITNGSINRQQALSTSGVCPSNASVELSYNMIGRTWKIVDITFDSAINKASNTATMTELQTFLGAMIDKTVMFGYLEKNRFTDNAKYKNYNANTCLTEEDANYYINQFNIITNYKNNASYVKMFKNNGFVNIANSIVVGYMPDSACVKQHPELADLYSKLQKAAQDALNVMNNTTDKTPKDICEYILGDPSQPGDFAYYLNVTFRFIKFAAPILLICVTIFDYIKAIAASDGDAIMKTNKKTLTRLIFTLLIFMLPILISTILSLTGVQGSCGISK